MIISILTLLLSFLPQEPAIVYKPDSEFVMTLDYSVKERPAVDSDKKNAYDAFTQKEPAGPLPYLKINFKITKLAEDEVRIKVVTNTGKNVMNKKIQAGVIIKLDLGYTDDIKDRVSPNSYDIQFQNEAKAILKIIRVEIQQDGTFLLNGEKRGKF